MKLKALILNGTLKKSPLVSNTQALIDKAIVLFKEHNVGTETVRIVDHYIPFGVSSQEDEKDELRYFSYRLANLVRSPLFCNPVSS